MIKTISAVTIRLRWLVWAGFWLLSLAAISVSGGVVSYGLFFGVSLLPALSLVYLLCVYGGFKIYQETEGRSMVCGQPVPYFFVLQNDVWFAFAGVGVRLFSSFSSVEELPGDTEYGLLPGDRVVYETKLVCKYRGEYEVGIKEVVVTDCFRLFRVRYAIPSTIKVFVLPRLVLLEELVHVPELSSLQREIAAGAEADIVVRDYVEGDPLGRIHWKATAREQSLKVRMQIGEERQGISIFCDTRRYSREIKQYLPLENRILEVLLALGFFFAGRELGVSVYYGQSSFIKQEVSGVKEFDRFYRRAAELVFQEWEDSAERFCQAVEQGVFWGSKLVFGIFHELDNRILAATERLAASGMMVIVYVVTDHLSEEFLRQGSERRRIVVVPIEAALEGVL